MKDNISVLVVDDEPGIRILLHNLLKDMGLGDVRVSGRGEEALKVLMREKVDLMLLDLRMPGMDGQETARRSLQIWPDLVILIVTGYATVDSAVELMKHGVFDIVRKPFQYEEFKEKVDKALAEVNRRFQERAAKQTMQRFGRYVILSEVSRGGMGVVYRAKHVDSDRTVALKVLEAQKSKPEQVARFYLEGDTIAKLRHPGIVQIQDMGICEGHHFIAMDFIDGVSLYDMIYGNDLSYKRGMKILVEVLEALQYAHAQGVIHRDLKPSNVIIDKAGQPHLIDFGLAKFVTGRIKITQTDLILGTFGYLAPERLVGDHVDHRADIYSMGAILYEMLTHRLPYEKEDDVHVFPVFDAGAVAPSAINPQVPPDLEAICLKAIAVRRDDRYASAEEFAQALREFLEVLDEGDAIR